MTHSSRITTGILSFLALLPWGNATAYDAPIGIPEPPFGIDETHYIYAGLPGYSDAGNGPYTHYVDNSADCTDNDNPTGTYENPRCSVPTSLEAGSVVEIHGGPYTGGDTTWTLNGSATQPVFIRGTGSNSKPQFTDSGRRIITITGSYGIVEYIDALNGAAVEFRAASNLALRHSHVHDHPGKGNIVGVTGASSYIVIYDNEINNNGQIPSSSDNHGVYTGGNTDHIWILENHIHHNSGDGIQFCHGCIGNGNGPSNVFIGRNVIHEDEENAIDVKEFIGPVVVSENYMYGYRPGVYSGNGDAFRVNDEGDQGDLWILYNSISDSTRGIEPSRSDATVYVIGNVIHDIVRGAVGSDADFVINNTIYNAGTGVGAGEARSNIIVDSATAVGGDVSGCSHNLIRGGSTQSNCSNTVGADPQFVFGANNDVIGIQSGSPAIGAGYGNHPVYDTYQSRFGISIRVDVNGNPRPVGQGWAIGAHELFDSVAPKAPTDLEIVQ